MFKHQRLVPWEDIALTNACCPPILVLEQGVKDRLERQLRENQEKKSVAERVVREAEAAAAAAKRKNETKPVPSTA